ncbi:MAG: sodium:proton antiporter [Solirubrobacterales bacterium]|nr:sodium:proton antiporter [Solirubrobacterales bacterium]
MEWSLALVALALLGVAAVSRRLSGTPVTAAMLFVAFGLLVGPEVLDGVDVSSSSAAVRTLAEATLALVLFSDASRIDLGALRRTVGVPVRLLGIGLPLTIALGAVAAAAVLGELSAEEAVILAVVLAPTDAALGQAVVTEPRVPQRIRQGLNVESGLNDGICVPLLFAAVAFADVESEISGGRSPGTLLLEEIGYGILGGVAAGLLIAAIVTQAGRRDLIAPAWRQVVPAAGAALAYGIASALDGSGFIAAFVAGMVFRLALGRDPEELNRLTEEVGSVLNGVTFVLFGAVLLGPALSELSWQLALYSLLSLTVVRMLPVVVAMWGSRARRPTLGFLGWFGPRGLASIVFAVIVIEESQLPHEHLLVLAIYLTVGLSVLAHGLTAAPLAGRYARWYEQHPREKAPPMESAPAEVTRPRGPVGHAT